MSSWQADTVTNRKLWPISPSPSHLSRVTFKCRVSALRAPANLQRLLISVQLLSIFSPFRVESYTSSIHVAKSSFLFCLQRSPIFHISFTFCLVGYKTAYFQCPYIQLRIHAIKPSYVLQKLHDRVVENWASELCELYNTSEVARGLWEQSSFIEVRFIYLFIVLKKCSWD